MNDLNAAYSYLGAGIEESTQLSNSDPWTFFSVRNVTASPAGMFMGWGKQISATVISANYAQWY